MFFLVIGLIIVAFGLYYVPVKEAYYTNLSNKTPKSFNVFLAVWVFTSMAYIPFICKILLEGLVALGYMEFTEGEGAAYFIMIGSVILYSILYKAYTSRLKTHNDNIKMNV